MKLFAIKKIHEEEEEEKKPQLRKRETNTNKPLKVKDLSPENKKKRKEPPKPWGKGERMLILWVLLTTVILATLMSVKAGNWKLGFSFPKLSFPILQEGVIILEKGD